MKTQSHFLLVHVVNKEANDPTPHPRIINTAHIYEITPVLKPHPLVRCRITFDYLSVEHETPAHIFVADGFDVLTQELTGLGLSAADVAQLKYALESDEVWSLPAEQGAAQELNQV